jgi:uncharacterized membrane protein YdbT with pleckstrin-like domain
MPPAELKLLVLNPSLKNWPVLVGIGLLVFFTGAVGLVLLIFSYSTALVVAACGLALISWPALKTANTEYIVTNLRVCSLTGLFRKRGWEVPVQDIREIRVSRRPIQQTLGIGDLELVLPGGARCLEGLEEPERVRDRILSLI